ncbi:MAG TPA: transcription termination/antitermination NusG family protein [Anaerolineales bacterium]|jgi:transcriptional antiterminator RfaH
MTDGLLGQWYALRSQAHKERLLWRQVETRGFEVFYPRLRVRPVNPRSRKIRPFFPGYLFIKADLSAVGESIFNRLPYSMGLVGFGGEPAPIRDHVIHHLQQRVGELNAARVHYLDQFQHGDPVRITDGPFGGYEAIFDLRLTGQDRVRLLLEMLSGRWVHVQVGGNQIERVRPSEQRS